MSQLPEHNSAWRPVTSVPQPLTTSRFVIEPLEETHAEKDFAALMSCRHRLRHELQWSDWPTDDFSVDANRTDLRRHREEFERGEAFAYTVLYPNRDQCLGCLYIEPSVEFDGAQLAYWVVDDAIEIEADLVTIIVHWLHTEWSVNRVVIPLHKHNTRGIALAAEAGFVPVPSPGSGPISEHQCFLSETQHTTS